MIKHIISKYNAYVFTKIYAQYIKYYKQQNEFNEFKKIIINYNHYDQTEQIKKQLSEATATIFFLG